MNDRADSLLTFDLRAFARDYTGTPFGSRCKTAADELDRLYEVERRLRTALTLLVDDVQQYEAWQRPCHALDVANAALAKAHGPGSPQTLSNVEENHG